MKIEDIKLKLIALAKERHGENITPLPNGRDFVFDNFSDCFVYTYELPNKSSCAVIATYNEEMFKLFGKNAAIYLEDD